MIWNTKHASIDAKIKLHLVIHVNLTFWNSKICSGNQSDLNFLDSFHYINIRRILKISILKVKD